MRYNNLSHYLASIPTVVLLIAAGAAFGIAVRWRWRWCYLIDLCLIALVIEQLSIRLLTWAVVLTFLRYVPAFAEDIAGLADVKSYDGWTLALWWLLLPGAAPHADAYVPIASESTVALTPPPVHPPAAPSPQPVAPTLLRPAAWLGAVNDDATAPHLGVVGPTRMGKTTFVLACLGRRAGLLVITTPKAQDVDPWGGAIVTRLRIDLDARSVDWTPIEAAIDSVHYEMLRRNATNTAREAPRLSLIVDELSTTLANCARRTKSQIIEMWNMGAGANINLIVCDPEVNSAAWGIQGRRDILGNLVFAQVAPGRRWGLGRIDPNGRLIDPQAMDTASLLTLAGEARLAGRGWPGVAVGVPGLPPPHPPATGAPPALESLGTGTEPEPGTPIGVLRALRSSGMTRDRAREIGCKFRDLDWTAAGKPGETP